MVYEKLRLDRVTFRLDRFAVSLSLFTNKSIPIRICIYINTFNNTSLVIYFNLQFVLRITNIVRIKQMNLRSRQKVQKVIMIQFMVYRMYNISNFD